MKIDIRGIKFDNVTLNEAGEIVRELINTNQSHYVVTPNSEIVHMCIHDKNLENIINGASLIIPDGIGVVYASKILKRPLKTKVAGVELGKLTLKILEEEGKSLYLLGGKEEVVQTAAKKLKEEFPKLDICGIRNGYFKDDDEVIADINEKQPDVVFVCLGAPKQEIWISKNISKTNNCLLFGLGGSLDVYSGMTKRAPDIFVKLGLEWFYRLIKEPYRIGRMMRLPKFLFGTVFYKIKNGKNA